MSRPPPKAPPKTKGKASDGDDDKEIQLKEEQARLSPLSAPGTNKMHQQPGPVKHVKKGAIVANVPDTVKKSDSDSSSDGSKSSETPPKVSIAKLKPQTHEKKNEPRESMEEPTEVHIVVPEDLKVKPNIFQKKERAWRQKPKEEEKVKVDKEKPPPRLEFMDPAFPTFGGRRSAVTKVFEIKHEANIPVKVPTKEPTSVERKPPVVKSASPTPKPPTKAEKPDESETPLEQPAVVKPALPSEGGRKSALAKMRAATKMAAKQPKRVIELSKAKAAEMFGFQSKLATMDTSLFTAEYSGSEEEESRSVSSGDTSGPDQSWILEWSGEDVSESSDEDHEELQRNYTLNAASTNAALCPLFLMMFFTGRLPFSGGLSTRYETVYFSFPKNTWKFMIFCVTSGLLFLLWILTVVSAFDILRYDAADSEKYKKLEDLYLEKYWLQVSIFLAMLTYVNFVNIITLLYGDAVTTWLNTVIRIVNMHDMDLTKWIWIYGVGQLFLLLHYLVYMILMFRSGGTPGVVGGTNALTVVIFHYIYEAVRLNFDAFPHLSAFVFVIQLYVLICARFCIMLPMLCSMFVRNMAQNRNLRIGLIVGTVKTHGNKTTENFRNALTYRNVFAFHNQANRMLRDFCNLAFPYHICAYYTVKCCVLCLCLFKIAKTTGVSFFPTAEQRSFNETAVLDNTGNLIETYEDAASVTIYDTLVLFGISLLGFVTVTEIFTDCSKTFLEGFNYIRNHAIFRSKGSQERKFVLSLNQCFTTINPYVVSPSSLFTIDRRFIIRVFEWCGLVFMIMIQTQSSPLLKTPILGICEDSSGNNAICVVAFGVGPRTTANRWNHVNAETGKQFEKIKEAERLAALSMTSTSTVSTTSGTSPTAAPKPSTTTTTTASTTTITTTTTIAPTSTTTAPPPPTPPPPSFAMKYVGKRCNNSDVFRLYVFYSWGKSDVPADRFECIVRPYSRLPGGMDAFGRPSLSFDDCGFPSFSHSSTYKPPYSYRPVDSHKTTYRLDGRDFACWDVMDDRQHETVTREQSPATTCGYPTDYAAQLCDATNWGLSMDETRELIKKNPPKSKVNFSTPCEWDDFQFDKNRTEIQRLSPGEGFIREGRDFIYIKKSARKDNGVYVRFIAFTKDRLPWPMKKSDTYEVLPYPARSILDENKPAPYYDCTGKLLEKYDDSGYLGFTTFDPKIKQKKIDPALVSITLDINGKPETIKCFKMLIQLNYKNYVLDTSRSSNLICGILDSDPKFKERVWESVQAFRKFSTDNLAYVGEY